MCYIVNIIHNKIINIINMNNSSDNITDKATLEFMINPQYNNMNLAGNKDKENEES